EIVQISENEYHVLGSADIEEVFEKFDISEEIDVMTASGWVMNVLGRIPNEGDSFVYKNLDVTVLSMDENRVGKISIVVKENTEE
ncbi:MAG: HlyC/CorC family transporter, partial [Oscillospiraceae bacterium]|nr:HlyC/CorC family transporter [Oscillospiraceae bacterium]